MAERREPHLSGSSTTKHVVFWVVAAVVIFLFWSVSARIQRNETRLTYSDFLAQVGRGDVSHVTIHRNEIKGEFKNGQSFITVAPPQASGLIELLHTNDVEVSAQNANTPSLVGHLIAWTPIVIMIAFLIFFMRTMQRPTGASSELRRQAMVEKRLELKAKVLRAILDAGDGSEAELRARVLLDSDSDWVLNEFHKALYEMLNEGRVILTDDKKYALPPKR